MCSLADWATQVLVTYSLVEIGTRRASQGVTDTRTLTYKETMHRLVWRAEYKVRNMNTALSSLCRSRLPNYKERLRLKIKVTKSYESLSPECIMWSNSPEECNIYIRLTPVLQLVLAPIFDQFTYSVGASKTKQIKLAFPTEFP